MNSSESKVKSKLVLAENLNFNHDKLKKNKNHNLIDKNYEYDRTKNTAQTLIFKHTNEAFNNKKVKVQY